MRIGGLLDTSTELTEAWWMMNNRGSLNCAKTLHPSTLFSPGRDNIALCASFKRR